LYNDPPQFLDHYYHFAAELLFGTWAAWRGTFHQALSVLSYTAANATTGGPIAADADPRALPHRAIFAHSPDGNPGLTAGDQKSGLRDKYGLNALFLRAAFPSVALEDEQNWIERGVATQHGRAAWHFPTLLLVDRSAAFRGKIVENCHRTAAAVYYPQARAGNISSDWWEPVRQAVLGAIIPALSEADQALPFPQPNFGFPGVDVDGAGPSRLPLVPDDMRLRPELEGGARRMRADNRFNDAAWEKILASEHALRVRAAALESQGRDTLDEKVVVTYISRQSSRRRLRDGDHTALVALLESTAARRGWELNIVRAELLTTAAQLALAARTTILLGVHGNGLTHLLMMAPNPRSTVIEIFYPEGFAHDYEWTTRALGMKHFGVWNDTSVTWPELPWVVYPDGFQGTNIPVYAPHILELIEGRVDGQI
jgi:hypothetical protein